MNWFKNLKIRSKIIASFSLVIILMGIVGLIGVVEIHSIDVLDTELYEANTRPIVLLNTVQDNIQKNRIELRNMIIDNNTSINKEIIVQNDKEVDKALDEFKTTIKVQSVTDEYNSLRINIEKYIPIRDKVIDLFNQNKKDEAISLMDGDGSKIAKNINDTITKLIVIKEAQAREKSDINSKTAATAIISMLVTIGVGIILSIALVIIISGMISKPIQRVVNMIQEMGKGHLGERLNINTKDEVGEMANAMDTFADDLQISVIEVMNKISEGDVSVNITLKDGKDEISPALKKTIETIRELNKGINKLIKDVIEGKLDVRGNGDLYSGEWKEIVVGINELIDAFVAPINVTAEYIDRISKGDIPEKITDTYKGDFNEIKNNLNNCIDNIRALVTDANMLSKAAAEGRLDTRADAAKHSGDFKKIVEGINELIEAMVIPIKEVTNVMSEISRGNLEVSINGQYRGEFGVLTKAVNNTEEYLKDVVGEISEIMQEISRGNLALENVKEFNGNFKSISTSLNTIINSLNSVLGDINAASDQVYAGASQFSYASQGLAQGATEQASAIEELTSSITEVAAQTRENANNASQAKDLAISVKDNAEVGNKHMNEMLKSMGEINESSASISKIIKVIDEIAFQTNILALNAAVEAARAGQHGKGFAVVAEEVRNLAARSANAAKETTALIEGSIKKSEKGTEIANNTAKALDEIVEGVSKAAKLVAEIAASSEEQASGILQINVGIEQVSQVVQTNSATAEESASTSKELSSQSESLKRMVSNFKLKNNNSKLNNENEDYMNTRYYNNESNVAYREVAATSNHLNIDLSDKEFDKY
ncbi:methyl-accepting chemotaxis protein [Clostridium sp. C2-6-12]|uniref:methyl-accepting chemotaxis protein n=1 Tax=Clostridium sp. C2-6-12 TaxID=2698832 RepID=UPI00136FC83E|nr:methyl-accepting chemotaxis protein [Clostridium sp. C2-6-12]